MLVGGATPAVPRSPPQRARRARGRSPEVAEGGEVEGVLAEERIQVVDAEVGKVSASAEIATFPANPVHLSRRGRLAVAPAFFMLFPPQILPPNPQRRALPQQPSAGSEMDRRGAQGRARTLFFHMVSGLGRQFSYER